MSSKKKVSLIRRGESSSQPVTRDPRFDGLSGEFDETTFQSSYGFLSDLRAEEKETLQKDLKGCKTEGERNKLVKVINRLNTTEQTQKLKEERQLLKAESRKKALAGVKDGKNPYFEKKGELRKKELTRKFSELKKEGKVDKYMAKRRKKNIQKDRKGL